MSSLKRNNLAFDSKSKANNKSSVKKNIDKLDNPMKIYEYQNRVHMIQQKINQRVKEEQKYIEKNLTKIKSNFNNFTSRNFYRNYQKFSEKYFKTTDIIEDIAEKYHEKGYIIPKLSLNLSKVNPLLDSNSSKLFISYLFDRKKGEKVNYEKLYKKNKGIKYMNKLEDIIFPERAIERERQREKEKEKKKKLKKQRKKQKKYRLIENKMKKSDTGLMYFRNNRNYHINTETLNKKTKSSRSIQKYYFKNNNKTSNSFYNSKNDKSQINRSKSINYQSPSPIIKKYRKDKKLDSNILNLKKKSELHLNLTIEKTNVKNSSNNLSIFSTANNIQTNSNIKLENKLTEKKDENSLDTPKNKNKIDISSQNKSTNTKPFSSNNTESNFSSNHKVQSSKNNNFLLSFKIKEFSVNSKKEKNTSESKKIVINDFNSKYISNPKLSRYSYTFSLKNNQIENNKIDNYIKDEEKSTINSKKINLSERKEKSINRIYKQLKAGKYENIENKMRNYLSKTKKMEENEIDFMINQYEYKNVKSNYNELKKYINDKKLNKKIERIYLSNHDYNRIEPLLNILNRKDKEILQFDNKISKIYNKS